MTVIDSQTRAFTDAYTRALTSSWASDDYAERLQSDPRAALEEVGLSVPPQAQIEIVRTQITDDSDEEGLEAQIAMWLEGHRTGTYRLLIPDPPELDTAELDLDDMATIGGGFACCCCGPCSCCS
ncbi:hypothetical protein NF556_09440 [Ornithinimicrobium faecis]|uniref:NHLP leader peptide family natural product n=1 Tax=Ornithinimicrobium faecis TaxID=2934158 RepID=A0ABY4YYX5_9MICO|nr:hypothetical protein [Ornithinimicrobium sp. HY1793]USQ81846.1 hypothetical protein NF556_09440 [Ornithinimicrobium sp. HY1793]